MIQGHECNKSSLAAKSLVMGREAMWDHAFRMRGNRHITLCLNCTRVWLFKAAWLCGDSAVAELHGYCNEIGKSIYPSMTYEYVMLFCRKCSDSTILQTRTDTRV